MAMARNMGTTWPPAEQLHHLQYCIHSNPSWHETVVLAFQHYIVMLGTTVLIANTLVSPMGGDPVCDVFGFWIRLSNIYVII
jgi:nucleobase transporter 1/2